MASQGPALAEALLTSSAEHVQVLRAQQERQARVAAVRLRLETTAHEAASSQCAELLKSSSQLSDENGDLKAEVETLRTDILVERRHSSALEEKVASLQSQVVELRDTLGATAAEAEPLKPASVFARRMAQDAVQAEVARSEERAARLETALKEAREREAAACSRADAASASAAADGERRSRQLRLQLEQLRDAASARDKEASEIMRQRESAERAAVSAAGAEAELRLRVGDLEHRLHGLEGISGERDALQLKVEQLGRLIELQGLELRKLQDGRAKNDAKLHGLKRQLTIERRAHRGAASRAAHQLRAQAEVAVFSSEVHHGYHASVGPAHASGMTMTTRPPSSLPSHPLHSQTCLPCNPSARHVGSAPTSGGVHVWSAPSHEHAKPAWSPAWTPSGGWGEPTSPSRREGGAAFCAAAYAHTPSPPIREHPYGDPREYAASDDDERDDDDEEADLDGGGSSPRESPRTPATRPDHQYTSGHAHHDGGCHSGAPDVDDDEAPGSADSVALAFKLKREAQSFATLLRAGAEGRHEVYYDDREP